MSDGNISREDALLWLNDRLGEYVTASFVIYEGDYSFDLLSAEGELRHWREHNDHWPGRRREDIEGLYEIGADRSSLNLTRLPVNAPVSLRGEAGDELVIELERNPSESGGVVALHIVTARP